MIKLGVNVDHIATLRQAREENFPDPVSAALEALSGGADGIVCHLREDRRHIQDDDLIRLRKALKRLDMEMAATDEMVKIALKLRPEMVTIVPEKRRELTTEGGLDVIKHKKKLKPMIEKLKNARIIISLFVDPEKGQIEESAVLLSEFIEIHTGKYAQSGSKRELEKVRGAAHLARSLGLRVNAGHGLDYHNAAEIARIPGIEELNIGFSIIARSVFVGMKKAVQEMRRAMR